MCPNKESEQNRENHDELDIEICFCFNNKKKENRYYRAGGEDSSPEAIKTIVKDIIKRYGFKYEEIEGIWITDYNDYDEENECHVEYPLWNFKEPEL
jgi:hypothetical protein